MNNHSIRKVTRRPDMDPPIFRTQCHLMLSSTRYRSVSKDVLNPRIVVSAKAFYSQQRRIAPLVIAEFVNSLGLSCCCVIYFTFEPDSCWVTVARSFTGGDRLRQPNVGRGLWDGTI
jgi:hypothetical protein